MHRRAFLKRSAVAASFLALRSPDSAGRVGGEEPPFRVSLAHWSLHRRHFNESKLPALDFPRVAREEFGIEAIELVNTMLPVPTFSFLQQLRGEADKHRVKILLIMCDGEGDLGSGDEGHRLQAVRNHHKWVDIAEVLGCHSIRVNSGGKEKDEASIEQCADSLRRLADYGEERKIHVIVENHGGLSSHPPSLLEVIEKADTPWLGTLPDFGNFPESVDRYEAIRAMMPHAKAVSAKCYDFDTQGRETKIDFPRMMKIVTDAGYKGYVGIEYEGNRMSEADGIKAARKLLDSIASSAG